RKNIALAGLVIQHDTTPFYQGDAVSLDKTTNVLLQDCTIQWNSHKGVNDGNVKNLILRRDVLDNNGLAGMGGSKIKGLTIENTEASYNNWRGGLGGFTGWDPAGVKQLYLHDAIIRGLNASNNQARGLWLDTNCINVLVDKATLNSNVKDGIFIEANEGPITIQNSVIARNAEYGVKDANAAGVILKNN